MNQTATAPAALPAGTRVRIVGYSARYDGLTGVVATDATRGFESYVAVQLDRRATAEESALLFEPRNLEALPESAISLVRAVAPRHARAPHAAPVKTRIGTRLHQLVQATAAMDAKDARIAELEAQLEHVTTALTKATVSRDAAHRKLDAVRTALYR